MGDSSSSSSSSSSEIGGKLDDSNGIELTGKIMVVAIISVFFAVVTIFVIHLYAKWLRHRRPDSPSATQRRRRRRFDFAGGYNGEINTVRRGLDPAVLKAIPVFTFNPKEELECAVCLSQICEGEKARLLPKCNHGFHVDCIDMWFHSHSTCPLCRNPVSKSDFIPREAPEVSSASCLQEACSSSSSRGEGKLVIDIPREVVEDDEEQKSPMSGRMRSLKRLLSRGKRVIPSPSSPGSNLDVEQGGRSQS